MTRIVYGYSGEGSGHSSRTREIADHLLRSGHEVRLASYGRGYDNLHAEFDVLPIEGLTISSEDNRVSKFNTITENLKRLPQGSRRLWALRDVFKEFQPHAVVTDFEPMTAYLAEHFGVPLISIDNQHRMRYVSYEPPPGRESEARLTCNLVRMMVPWPSVALITALVDGPTTNDRSYVFPPIVRQSVRQLSIQNQNHVLVYLTSGFDSLVSELSKFPREEFFVYGQGRDAADGNLKFFRPSNQQFLEHLASCKAVIATAGFTLISEALFLRKPYLAFPMSGQYEQELNAHQLSQSGYGEFAGEPSDKDIGSFLYRIPEFVARLQEYPQDDGMAIKMKLDELIANEAVMAQKFKESRS